MSMKDEAQVKAREICCSYRSNKPVETCFCKRYSEVLEMYKWTKKRVVEEACRLVQHWILEHDYVDMMEIEDYIKQQMEE